MAVPEGDGMRVAAVLIALALLSGTVLGVAFPARAAETPKLVITVEAGVGDEFVFDPEEIVVPFVPIILNITARNNGTTGAHTFSVRGNGAIVFELVVTNPGDRATGEFELVSATRIRVGGQAYDAERLGDGVKFFCRPHESLPMVGTITVGGGPAPERLEVGLFLRAYWIGIIGLVAMLVWVGFTFFLIKGSSRHMRDHRDHVRRGLT